ncbi:MAG: nucleotidyl transferase AbiEii/AbiGii toxin family protein [Deltaproteobacteria bacterium]|nr:nucleotidyl transferase AbiEii/AbiGii toxin family protein [Deltaproteobacteria bacterium]
MRPLRYRIREAVKRFGSPQPVVEKDYASSYILAGMALHPKLGDTLVFKGGTALKKLFFGDYRFSEDLDFSSRDAPVGELLERSLDESITRTGRLLSEYGPFDLQLERYLEREPHPHGQEAFTIRVKFPWHPSHLCRIKIEITQDEPVLLAPEKRRLLHEYGESLSVKICCYRLDEIVAEKLRTLLQTHQKLIARGWNRPRARDYYDLWRILGAFGASLDRMRIKSLLDQKCAFRGVVYHDPDDFFSDELVSETIRHWDAALEHFVPDLPEGQKVLSQLQVLLKNLFSDP